MTSTDESRRLGLRPKSVGFNNLRLQTPTSTSQFDIWKLIKRNDSVNTYNLTLRYRMNKHVSAKRPRTAGAVHRRRRHADSDTISDSDGRDSVQTNGTDMYDDNYFKEDYDFDGEDPVEPPIYPHLVIKPGTYAQELYRKACRHYGVTLSTHFYKSLLGEKVIMRRQRLGPLGTKAITVPLMEMLTIHTLDLTDNHLGPKGADYIAQLLTENNFIKHLNLSNNELGGTGVRNLSQVITKLDTLTSLNISGNGLGDREAEDVRPLIEDTHKLKVLNISHNQFREQGGVILGDALLWNDTLVELDLSWNHLRRKGAIKIADSIAKNTGLSKVNLSWNGLHMTGVRALGKALEKNTTLTELDLSSNRLDRECAEKFFSHLRKNTTLHILRIGNNPLTTDDYKEVLRLIHNNQTTGINVLDMKDEAVNGEFLTLLEDINKDRQMVVKYGKHLGADIGIRDTDERALVSTDPLTVMVVFGRIIGINMLEFFKGLYRYEDKHLNHFAVSKGLKAIHCPLSEVLTKLIVHRLDKYLDTNLVGGTNKYIFQTEVEGENEPNIDKSQQPDKTNKFSTPITKKHLENIMSKKLSGNIAYRHSLEEMRNDIFKFGDTLVRESIIGNVLTELSQKESLE